ncbi:hypothetical protein LCGC14_0613930 [marine sediment metagenome]|uniref:HD domain-containing protein n=1 Tax=marine sediment metagenome TaxID=412755 RepID=A0A0F9UFC8_9ZZZZ
MIDPEEGAWIQTYTGRKFHFELEHRYPEQEISLTDIVHSLSQQTRFVGHTETFYSVAEHSMLVSDMVSDKNKLTALMHDAHEAYTGDVNKPFKTLLPQLKIYENQIMSDISAIFGLVYPFPDEVKLADKVICQLEREQLFPQEPYQTAGSNEILESLEYARMKDLEIRCLSQSHVELSFFRCIMACKNWWCT